MNWERDLAQCLMRFGPQVSWQAQHVVKFWSTTGERSVVFSYKMRCQGGL